MELGNPVCVVTGASSGIGRATALEMARNGWRVVLHARRARGPLEELAAEIGRLGGQSALLLADLAESAPRSAFADQAFAAFGSVDAWVNNAGCDVLTGPDARGTFEEKLERLWRVDVAATLLLARAAGRRMIDAARARSSEAGAFSIVNVGWDQAEQGMAGDAGELFAAAKGAVMAATRSLAQSLAPCVRVNCVAPGWIRTAWGEHASPTWQQRARSESLMGRWGSCEDVARAVAFLCSPQAAFISGQILAINGGFRYSRHELPAAEHE